MSEYAIEQAEVNRFVATSNIVRFVAMLEHETDPKEKALLQRMLAEERQRLRQASHPTACADSAHASAGQ